MREEPFQIFGRCCMADHSQRAKIMKPAAGNASFLVPSDIFSRIEPVGMNENRLENTISEKKVKNYHSSFPVQSFVFELMIFSIVTYSVSFSFISFISLSNESLETLSYSKIEAFFLGGSLFSILNKKRLHFLQFNILQKQCNCCSGSELVFQFKK